MDGDLPNQKIKKSVVGSVGAYLWAEYANHRVVSVWRAQLCDYARRFIFRAGFDRILRSLRRRMWGGVWTTRGDHFGMESYAKEITITKKTLAASKEVASCVIILIFLKIVTCIVQ
jgi:hypothetical protein